MNCQKFESVVSELARGQMMAAELRGEALAHVDGCEDCAVRLRNVDAWVEFARRGNGIVVSARDGRGKLASGFSCPFGSCSDCEETVAFLLLGSRGRSDVIDRDQRVRVSVDQWTG